MLPHGWGKLMMLVSGQHAFADPMGIGQLPTLVLAVFSEFVCPILLLVGFKTTWAAVPPALTMAVAAFVIHFQDPWSKKELALLYLVGFVVVGLLGSGRYSLDAFLEGRLKSGYPGGEIDPREALPFPQTLQLPLASDSARCSTPAVCTSAGSC